MMNKRNFSGWDVADGIGTLIFAIVAAVLMLLVEPAGATPPLPPPDKKAPVEHTITQKNYFNQDASAAASADPTATASASNDGVTLEVDAHDASTSTTTTTNNARTNVYALALEFPNLVGCIGGGQGGIGDERGNSGFLGLNMLNVSCWRQQLAESEEDLDIRARLKCGDKHYRRAINLGDRKGRVGVEMQKCIAYVLPRWTAQLEHERAAAEAAAAELAGNNAEAQRSVDNLKAQVSDLNDQLRQQDSAHRAEKRQLGEECTEKVVARAEECFQTYGPEKTK